ARGPPLLPRVKHDLGVAMGPKPVTTGAQPVRDLAVIVDLAVVDDDDASGIVTHRLLALGEIDDRKAAVREPDVAVDKDALLVGPAVLLHRVHALEQGTRDLPAASEIDDTGDSAHG